MPESKKRTARNWRDPDEAPDLSKPAWKKKFASIKVSRGRPKIENPKISTTIRLDADVIEKFKAKGARWQTRINDALREWLKKAG